MEDIDLEQRALKLEVEFTNLTKKEIIKIMQNTQLIDCYVDDLDDVDKAITNIRYQVTEITEWVQSVIIGIETSFRMLHKSVPDSVRERYSSLQRLSEFSTTILEKKQRDYQKAKAIRSGYSEALEDVHAFLLKAQARLQDNSSLPEAALDGIQVLLSEIPPVTSKLDSARRNGSLIVENTEKAEVKQFILRSIFSIEDQMNKVESSLYERKVQLKDAIHTRGQLLLAQQHVRKWILKRNSYLSLDTEILQLQDAKQKLSDLRLSSKSSTRVDRPIIKSMRKKLDKISDVCSTGYLADMQDDIEQDDRSTECRLLQQVSLLEELVEEWELCERKIKEVAAWFDTTKSYLESPCFEKRSLRDQLKTREEIMLDIAIHKTKVLTALEKLQFHLLSPMNGQYRISALEQNVRGELKKFYCQIGEQNDLLLVRVKNQHQCLQSLRHSEYRAEHQLKLADKQSVGVEEKEKPKEMQQIIPSEEIHNSTEKDVFKATITESEYQRYGKPFVESHTTDLQSVKEFLAHPNYHDQSPSCVYAVQVSSSPSHHKQTQVKYATSVKSGSKPANNQANNVLEERVVQMSRKEQSNKLESSSTAVLSQGTATLLDKNVTVHFSAITSHESQEVTHKRSIRTQLNSNASTSSENSEIETLVSASDFDSVQRVLSAQSSQTRHRCSFIQKCTETDNFTCILPQNVDAALTEVRQTFMDFKPKTIHSKLHVKATRIISVVSKQFISKMASTFVITPSAMGDSRYISHRREYCSPPDANSYKVRGVEDLWPAFVQIGKAVQMRQQRKVQTRLKQREFSSITADSKSSITHSEAESELDEDKLPETGQLFQKLESSKYMSSEQSSQISFIQQPKLRDSITDTLDDPPCSTGEIQTIPGFKSKKTALFKTRVRPSVVQRLFKTQMSAFEAKDL